VLIGPVQAAIYTAATRFLVAGQLGNAAISMAAQPQFTKLFAVGDRDGANAVYQATTAWLIMLTWPLYLLAVIFGPYVLVIFGHAYHAGSTVMLILGLAMLVATACGQVDMVLITTGRSSWSLYNGLLAMVVNVGVDLILIPRLGITGAAVGWAAAIGITNLVPLVQVATAAKVHPFGPGTLWSVLLATFSFAAIPLTVRALAGNGAPQVIASLAAGGLVMALGLYLLRGPLQLAVLPLPKVRRRLRTAPSGQWGQQRQRVNDAVPPRRGTASLTPRRCYYDGSGSAMLRPAGAEQRRRVSDAAGRRDLSSAAGPWRPSGRNAGISFGQNRSLLTGYSPSSDKGVNSGVIKYLVALIWPIGLAIIAAAAFLGSRRYATTEVTVSPAAGRPSRSHKVRGNRTGLTDFIWESARLGAFAVAGTVVVFGLMWALGQIVVYHGLAIDKPIFTWMIHHQVHALAGLMKRLTKIGDTWTCWGAAFAASVCLAATWRTKKWLPPSVLAGLIVIDHFTTLALRHVFHRLGPPTSPLGTYPSGGCDRVMVFYGLIAYLLWREFSGRRSTAIALGGGVAALGFNEAFSRVYLSLHWTTDAISGLLYGTLLLAVFITAVHLVAGPAIRPSAQPATSPSFQPEGVSLASGRHR
jgi:Polysaccharide biosynthesis C-terminal domain